MYSANCGGTGTLTGTSPNMIFKGYMEELHPKSDEITYASWIAYNVPSIILCITVGWTLLQVIYVPCWHKADQETKERIQSIISARYKELGRITFHEASVASLFSVLVLLWFFREPKFMPGWFDVLGPETHVGDAVPAIGILIIMFMLPASPYKPHKSPGLLTWKVFQDKLPWGLVLLLGGGYAMADGTQKSGLSKWLGKQMSKLFFLPPSAVLVILCIFTLSLTEFMSNSAVTSILLPAVNAMAVSFKVNPIYLMLPVTVSSSYAFMLPVATGPNAICFGTGILTTRDMLKPGILMNILALSIQMFMIHTLGTHLFNLNTFPDWANSTVNNTTDSTS